MNKSLACRLVHIVASPRSDRAVLPRLGQYDLNAFTAIQNGYSYAGCILLQAHVRVRVADEPRRTASNEICSSIGNQG